MTVPMTHPLDSNPLLDDALIMRLTYDLATGIHEPAHIAVRYGFANVGDMRAYLRERPGVIRAVQKMKAIMESDEASEARVRLKATHATEALIPATTGIAMDPRMPPQQRIDAFKQLSRVSGLDGSAAALAAKQASGAAFTLNILFRDKPGENLTVTPIAAVPTFTTSSKLIAEGEDDDEVEDI